jgi:hypothetical protein
MIELSARQHRPEPDERRIVVLELVAACTLVCIFAVVLYMVFTYRPL